MRADPQLFGARGPGLKAMFGAVFELSGSLRRGLGAASLPGFDAHNPRPVAQDALAGCLDGPKNLANIRRSSADGSRRSRLASVLDPLGPWANALAAFNRSAAYGPSADKQDKSRRDNYPDGQKRPWPG